MKALEDKSVNLRVCGYEDRGAIILGRILSLFRDGWRAVHRDRDALACQAPPCYVEFLIVVVARLVAACRVDDDGSMSKPHKMDSVKSALAR